MNENILTVEYHCTGKSTATDALGMREMQARAYDKREEQYLLLKAPPASGKSRALMFLALYKLNHQGIKKAIVAVPERTIGSSFAATPLSRYGFECDWEPDERYNLCTVGSDSNSGKIAKFKEFLTDSSARILICTHATLRFAFEGLPTEAFNECLLAIDEFHHVSADQTNSRLGALVHEVLSKTNAHVIAMTGSYFRGDSVPILLPADESKFSRVVYTYYDQLNGYKYLRSLGIGYHFYQGSYLDAIPEVLDINKKTIIHIPSVNSAASTKDKNAEVDGILEAIGCVEGADSETGIIYVRAKDGRRLKVADLVEDTPLRRNKVVDYLRHVQKPEDLDIIIALGMAKEGFDWPMCEHALTIGYRSSLTEVIQIIGRATRDYPNKFHTQFTNLVAAPAATQDEVILSVNNLLKAISASLMMEQVLAPDFSFLSKTANREEDLPRTIKIKGMKDPSSDRVKDIIENDLSDLKVALFQDPRTQKFMADKDLYPEIVNRYLIPQIIEEKYEGLEAAEVEEIKDYLLADIFVKKSRIVEEEKDGKTRRFIEISNRFINIEDLDINLISSINPFEDAFEILSKQLDKPTLRLIRDAIMEKRTAMSLENAIMHWNAIREFIKANGGREPDMASEDRLESTLGEAMLVIKKEKKRREANGQ